MLLFPSIKANITLISILFMVTVHTWASTGKSRCPLHHTHTHTPACVCSRQASLTASGCPPQSPSLLLYLSPYSSILKKWLWLLELLHSTLRAWPVSPVVFFPAFMKHAGIKVKMRFYGRFRCVADTRMGFPICKMKLSRLLLDKMTFNWI